MENKKPTHLQHCDLCHARVVYEVGTQDEYTLTEVGEDTVSISFYCPDCIAKHHIVTDAHRPPLSFGGDEL